MQIGKLIQICILIILSCSVLIAQTPNLNSNRGQSRTGKTTSDSRRDFRLPLRQSFQNQKKRDLAKQKEADFKHDAEVQALEAAVDPQLYRVGPGDQFLISIWSTLENSIPARVTPAGKLVIPTIGAIEVDGHTLADVQATVKREVASKYLNSEISVDLVMVRGIRVHVTGQVVFPGAISILAVHRVADAIELAGGLTSWAFERGIVVRHSDGTVDRVDMFQYLKHGDLSANFYLRGGDVIHVPAINLDKPTVRVEGAINDPGIYEINRRETLRDFLLRVDALSRRTEMKYATIERQSHESVEPEIIPIFKYLESSGNGQADLVLQDGDVINIPQRLEEVYVIGAVRYPGPYPYIPNFKAQDYVGLAGSMEQASKPGKTRVVRRDSNKELKGKDQPVSPGDVVFVPRRLEFGVREVTSVLVTVTNILLAMKALDVL